MKLFGRDITDVNSTLDTFAHVSQASGAPVGALISQVRTFGPVFKNANVSLDETVGFMGAMETAGVDVTRVMPAINASLRKASLGGVTDSQRTPRRTDREHPRHGERYGSRCRSQLRRSGLRVRSA